MPPKPELSQEQVLQAAFDLIMDQGIEAITARSLAERLHCSTQPIYRLYKSMDKLKEQAYDRAVRHLLAEATGDLPDGTDNGAVGSKPVAAPRGNGAAAQSREFPDQPALQFAIRFLEIAVAERQLFRSVYFSGIRSMNLEQEPFIGEELVKAFMRHSNRLKHVEDHLLREIYLKLSIYLMGMASLMNSGTIRLEMAEAVRMIREMYEILLGSHLTTND